MTTARQKAKTFLREESQFHLGFLPTEQSHPRTVELSRTLQEDIVSGIGQILDVDEDIVVMARAVLARESFASLVEAMGQSLQAGGRILFSGCGATGRLSILLEAMWREFWQGLAREFPDLAEQACAEDMEARVLSIMTGGDRALIRSVENFEDYQQFGRQQMAEIGLNDNDTVVAISEGGETSSVIGTAWGGVEAEASVFFVFNNPAELLSERIERSGALIRHPNVTVLDLTTGPMAVAGSTRMEATTAELLIVGAALEETIRSRFEGLGDETQRRRLGLDGGRHADYAAFFEQRLVELQGLANRQTLAEICQAEQTLYEQAGRVTYFADGFLLDLLTDTTERAPTFMLPPFRPADNRHAPPSWAFVKHPYLPTPQAWAKVLRRPMRTLEWEPETYRQLGAAESICQRPPALGQQELLRFEIGCEEEPSRFETSASLAMAVLVGQEVTTHLHSENRFLQAFAQQAKPFAQCGVLALGPAPPEDLPGFRWHIAYDHRPSPIGLWDHLAVKIVMNTISTATMARMGRVAGNWMVFAEATNKKLIDRGTRLIQSFTGADYITACETLHAVLEELAAWEDPSRAPEPPSVLAIRKLKPDGEIAE